MTIRSCAWSERVMTPLSRLSVLCCTSICTSLCAVTPEGSVFVMPKNVSVNHGESVTFMCAVDVAGSYELQWSHNGVVLPGENQSLLTVNSVIAAQGGNYTCSVVNVAGSGMDEGILYGKYIYCRTCFTATC